MHPRSALLALFLTLLACAGAPAPTGETAGADGHRLYVVNHGLHAGLLIARGDLLEELPALAETFADGAFVELGWGDEDFYRAPQATLQLTLRALLRPTPAVLHAVKVAGAPEGGEVLALRLGEDGYRRLLAFVGASFSRSTQGAPVELGPGLYGDSRFYRAEGRYSLLRTCNTWLAEALASGGCPLQPAGVVTAEHLMARLRQATRSDSAACQVAR